MNAKTFQSNLYHTRMISDMVKLYINELPIQIEYNKFNREVGYRAFKKQFKSDMREENQLVPDFKHNVPKNVYRDNVGEYRTKIARNLEKQARLLKLGMYILSDNIGLININVHKNKAEVLLDTTYDSLHKHGYRAIVNQNDDTAMPKGYSRSIVPGIIRETLAAAAIIESGIIDRAHQTGKLYIWDPFCGSGTFLIETLQMFRGDPLIRDHMQFCFEHWPIVANSEQNRKEFEQVKEEVFQRLMNYELDPEVDIRVIGSDKQVYREYIDRAQISRYRYHPNFDRKCDFKDNPLLLSYHFPELNRTYHEQLSDYAESNGKAVSVSRPNSLISQEPPFFR